MTDDFDGCYRKCHTQGKHTLEYGNCEHADKPEPTVSMSKVYTDTDGHPSIGFDQYTVGQLAELIEPAVRAEIILIDDQYTNIARSVAHAIIHRNDQDET